MNECTNERIKSGEGSGIEDLGQLLTVDSSKVWQAARHNKSVYLHVHVVATPDSEAKQLRKRQKELANAVAADAAEEEAEAAAAATVGGALSAPKSAPKSASKAGSSSFKATTTKERSSPG